MKKITMYTSGFCPYCIRAKNLLKNENLEFEEISLDGKDDELQKLIEKTGLKTVPQIFFGDELVGGFQELSGLNKEGALHDKLK